MRSKEIDASGLTFTARQAGDQGEPVLLLHGFPETSAMWEGLMADLAEAGYRCIAPDQRGYSPGARPTAVDAYGHRQIGSDVLAIATAAGFDRFHIVAHDWGAGAAWAALDLDTDHRIVSFTSLSIPHYRGFAEAVPDDPDGELYRMVLQMITAEDSVVDDVWAADDFAFLKGIWHDADEIERQRYYDVFSQPGALTAAFNWYRATNAHTRALDGTSLEFGPVSTPTMLVWGNRDEYVGRLSVTRGEKYMRGPYEFVELDAGHWLAREQPDAVRELTLRQLRANPLS
jgi:pimeloyl-ACP methyl ester carboxylesterase